MQTDRDVQVVPESLVPGSEFRMYSTDRATSHHEVAIVIAQLVALDARQQAHVLPAQRGEARVDAVDQHGFIVATTSH